MEVSKMVVETVKMSSKGQIVIPQLVREELDAHEGTVFAVIGGKEALILKKIATPSKEDLIKELEILAKKTKKKLQSKGITDKDLQAK